jgi:hypothetical protein
MVGNVENQQRENKMLTYSFFNGIIIFYGFFAPLLSAKAEKGAEAGPAFD